MVLSENMLHTCCFIGHREICETEELKVRLSKEIEKLVVDRQVDTFLFGSKSCFNSLCYDLVTEIRMRYPHIKRVYVRAEFPIIGEAYRRYLQNFYEHTDYPETVRGAGRATYVKRNNNMIDRSQFCIFYYKESCVPKERKSGTKIAYDYAVKQKKTIYRFPLAD